MRQKAFVPCNCGECYFCIHGYTTGVQHRQKHRNIKLVHLNSGTLAQVDKCSNDVYVDLGKGSDYCRQCMCKQKGAVDGRNNKLDRAIKKRLCTMYIFFKGVSSIRALRANTCTMCTGKRGKPATKNID